MSEDPLVKAVTGLMTAHHVTQQAVATLSRGLAATNQAVASTSKAVVTLQSAVTQLHTTVSDLQESVESLETTAVDLEASLVNEGTRIQALLDAVTTMAHNSSDTQKRLNKVEERLDRLEEAG